MRRFSPLSLLVLLMFLAVGCASHRAEKVAPRPDAPARVRGAGAADPATDEQPGKVYAAYVVLGPAAGTGTTGARPIARVITDAETPGCPVLEGANGTLPLSERRNPHGFEVKVCEAEIPLGEGFTVSWNGAALPVARPDPASLVLIGDSGCKDSDCGTDPASPFQELAREAAATGPDLVLHAGDFNYRGTGSHVPTAHGPLTAYDAGDDAPSDPECQLSSPYVSQNAAYSENPDRWDTWNQDLFEPAAELLAAAPWVVARGNHELCSRAGPGYFYFLDPSLGDAQPSCPPQGGATPPTEGDAWPYLVFRDPYVVDLGTLSIGVLDSANACDGFAPSTAPNDLLGRYEAQLAALLGDLAGANGAHWVLSHRPFWGVSGGSSGDWDVLNLTLQAALDNLSSPALPSLAVAGHMHVFQTLSFDASASLPPQLVVGNGGVELYAGLDEGTFEATVDGKAVQGVEIDHHGFLSLTLAADGSWQGTMIGKKEKQRATCSSSYPPGPVCREDTEASP